MTIWNNIYNIYNICTIGGAVCLAAALVLAVVAEIKARKLRREIKKLMEERNRKNG